MEQYEIPRIYKGSRHIITETNHVFSFPTHMHAYYEMTLYESFSGTVVINDSRFNMDEATVILVVPSDYHRIEVDETQTARYIKVMFDADVMGGIPLPDSSLLLRGIEKEGLVFQLFCELAGIKGQGVYKTQLLCTTVLALREKAMQLRPFQQKSGGKITQRALQKINEEYYTDISLASVAEELAISPQYLSGIFKENVGINFNKYLSSIRIRRAEELLTESRENITNICAMCGYRNLSHFIRSFKKEFGVSPAVYRKRKK
ncbi:MAG: helix-turn-helix transcriptional regulator [Clostridia bacterium]|nr:helix-turn-helix transcriptional regulator [Clostridia bacterium]